MNELISSVGTIKGVGPKAEQLFHKLGVNTVGDLLCFYPRGYDVYEEPVSINLLEEGRISAVEGIIRGAVIVTGNRGLQVTTLQLRDNTGVLKVVWFRMPFLKKTLNSGMQVIFRGRIKKTGNQVIMEQPEIFNPTEEYNKKNYTLQPRYTLVPGLTNNAILKAVKKCESLLEQVEDFLPKSIQTRQYLLDHKEAIMEMHFPKDKERFFIARQRLVFEEFLVFILSLRRLREKKAKSKNDFVFEEKDDIAIFLQSLPYDLTTAQVRVWKEIKGDMQGVHTMSRLIQGDVGSGKTIIALLGLMLAGLNGYQGALMAPTEVLAKQHYESIKSLLEIQKVPLKIALLTGSMTMKEKKAVYEQIANGEVDIVIGTHALIQEKARYANLALVVTDEQHRFGVKQRETLASKGKVPHILVMSATPIPRTLGIIIYGDLDISVIDELPANRLPIKNCVVNTNYRKTAYMFMEDQVKAGRQCYVICPMIEESEHLEVENVLDYTERLKQAFSDEIKVACLHGKMKQQEKDVLMEAYGKKEIDVLVSTTVIEVGINVPNATVMFIENAERFGLAQLHQLRGRVGRGKFQSYCIFMSGSKSKQTKKRLEILNKSNDGFFIASEDLKIRGPGDLFGIKQSGILEFQLGDVFQDAKLLEQVNREIDILLEEDPFLEKKENRKLHKHIKSYIENNNLEMSL